MTSTSARKRNNMQIILLIPWTIVAIVTAVPSNLEQTPTGAYKLSFDTPTYARTEDRGVDGTVMGQYSYVDAAGVNQFVKYEAGIGGFRVINASLPIATDVPVVEPQELVRERKMHMDAYVKLNSEPSFHEAKVELHQQEYIVEPVEDTSEVMAAKKQFFAEFAAVEQNVAKERAIQEKLIKEEEMQKKLIEEQTKLYEEQLLKQRTYETPFVPEAEINDRFIPQSVYSDQYISEQSLHQEKFLNEKELNKQLIEKQTKLYEEELLKNSAYEAPFVREAPSRGRFIPQPVYPKQYISEQSLHQQKLIKEQELEKQLLEEQTRLHEEQLLKQRTYETTFVPKAEINDRFIPQSVYSDQYISEQSLHQEKLFKEQELEQQRIEEQLLRQGAYKAPFISEAAVHGRFIPQTVYPEQYISERSLHQEKLIKEQELEKQLFEEQTRLHEEQLLRQRAYRAPFVPQAAIQSRFIPQSIYPEHSISKRPLHQGKFEIKELKKQVIEEQARLYEEELLGLRAYKVPFVSEDATHDKFIPQSIYLEQYISKQPVPQLAHRQDLSARYLGQDFYDQFYLSQQHQKNYQPNYY